MYIVIYKKWAVTSFKYWTPSLVNTLGKLKWSSNSTIGSGLAGNSSTVKMMHYLMLQANMFINYFKKQFPHYLNLKYFHKAPVFAQMR